MIQAITVLTLGVSLVAPLAAASLRGAVTDPSGAAIAGAALQVRGEGAKKNVRSGRSGGYEFATLTPGKYQVTVSAPGFATAIRNVNVEGAAILDVRLEIATLRSATNVSLGNRQLTLEPDANGGAVSVGQRRIAALSDDPDELALQLQALAGPAPGPNGGQMFVDGLTAGNLPPKSAIGEVRVNANPFSSEYDKPGFGRIEVFTKPGTEQFHGQIFAQFNNGALDSRNPLIAIGGPPPYRGELYSFNASGPLRKNRASFTLDGEVRRTNDDAFVLATTPAQSINEVVPAPQTRWALSPRVNYAINGKNTLTARYQQVGASVDNQGVGDFNLPSRAYAERQAEETAQITETAALSARAMSETHFQFLRATDRELASNSGVGIDVVGAFFGGGATIGNSRTATDSWEWSNLSSALRGKHTWKWGGRVRYGGPTNTSLANFAGTFTFYTLTQYEAALVGAAAPSQFSINAGTPATHIPQTDIGAFVNDDWRVRPNVMLSFGLRYEAQTNVGDRRDWAPRVGLAWGSNKTVLRAGAGVFYDRMPIATTLNAIRYNGVTQQSYLILNPSFFPAIPPLDELRASAQPQELQPVSSGILAPRLYQSSVSVERQWTKSARTAFTWIGSRGVHLLNARNVNAPLGGAYPFGDASVRLLTESAGLSRQSQAMAQAVINTKAATLFGNYTLSYGWDNNEGMPANPYDLRAEWGPSSYGGIRHRLVLGGSIAAPFGFSMSPFFVVNSGAPYDVTTGLDPNSTGFPAARPALLPWLAAGTCEGANLKYARGFGCFDLLPPPGTPVIGRNSAIGPWAVNLGLRIAHTWWFGGEASGGAISQAPAHAMPAMADSLGHKRYSVTLSAFTMNALNRANYGSPEGDLSSPYFGQPRSLGGLVVMTHGGAASTYNRKVDLQLRFTF